VNHACTGTLLSSLSHGLGHQHEIQMLSLQLSGVQVSFFCCLSEKYIHLLLSGAGNHDRLNVLRRP
jgi:hypothetical protein